MKHPLTNAKYRSPPEAGWYKVWGDSDRKDGPYWNRWDGQWQTILNGRFVESEDPKYLWWERKLCDVGGFENEYEEWQNAKRLVRGYA